MIYKVNTSNIFSRVTYLLVSILLCLSNNTHSAVAQVPQLNHLGIEKGLSHNSVQCVFQDHDGFLWFGTFDGLNRYDGYEFKVFRNKLNDTTSLPHNYVYSISEDKNYNLWVVTGQGACIYNKLTSRFKPVFYTPFGTGRSQKINEVNSIVTDASGNVFISTIRNGLIAYFRNSKTGVQIPLSDNSGQVNINYSASAIAVDSKQRVWIFISKIGLCRLDSRRRLLRVVNTNLDDVSYFKADNKENIWMGGQNGLIKFNIPSNKIIEVGNSENIPVIRSAVSSLFIDRKNQLWVGTKGRGLYVIDINTNKLTLKLSGTKTGLSSEYISAIFEDKEGRKWIGTLNGGLNIINPHKPKFTAVSHDLSPNSLVNNFASCFYEDENKNLWIGTEGGGFSIWNRHQNRFTNFSYEPGLSNSLSNNWVTRITRDYLGSIWISTFGGGINKFDKKSGRFTHYRCYDEKLKIENKIVRQIFEDRDKVLWATTYIEGRLYNFNRKEDRFEVFDRKLPDLNIITEDREGTLWTGDGYSLIKIDKKQRKHLYYPIKKPVRAIYESVDGDLWIGSEGGGLILFDRLKGIIKKRYSTSEGLCNNSVLTILQDAKGFLWLSTFHGLSRFNPKNGTFKNFYQEDGLQSNQFIYKSAFRTQSGELVFGGVKGFNIFHPDSIRFITNHPDVILTALRIKGLPVNVENGYIKNIKEDKIETIQIPYSDAVLSVDFAALEYSAADAIDYAYYLKGWDKRWNYSGKIRSANYTNLREGRYHLYIRSTNIEGEWGKTEKVLEIIVLPPWWRSWWAYLLYLITVIAVIGTYIGYLKEQERLKYDVKLADAKTEQEKALNEKKLTFFTQIHHEFRTPLTLIINPIKEFLNSKDSQVETKELIVVYRNARRLLGLVDQLLHFRKSEVNKLSVSKFNVAAFCREVYLCFVQHAKFRNVSFEFICEFEEISLWADKEKIELALVNLISNAFKSTPEHGSIQIILKEDDSNIEISVRDTGYGIEKELGDRVFENFFQSENKNAKNRTGFGIGLYLVKQVAESHSGRVFYTSKKGEGTEFTLQFLKGKAHYNVQSICEDLNEMPLQIEEFLDNEHPVVLEDTVLQEEPSFDIITEKKSLLIVDDNAEMRDYIRRIFQPSYTIHEASSSEQALEVIDKEVPDIVISDIVMGGISGLDLCTKIKGNIALAHIPVILLTSGTSAEIKLRGIEGGADDFITKPFDKDILLARVSNLLKSRNNLQKYFYNQITLKSDDFKVSPEIKVFLEKCIKITENHLDDPDFSVKILAEELGMSYSALYKKVKMISGQSINEFIRFIRLRKAAELFVTTDCNVSQGAYQCGMNDAKSFRKHFEKVFGMNPSEYIKKYRKHMNNPYKVNLNIGKND